MAQYICFAIGCALFGLGLQLGYVYDVCICLARACKYRETFAMGKHEYTELTYPTHISHTKVNWVEGQYDLLDWSITLNTHIQNLVLKPHAVITVIKLPLLSQFYCVWTIRIGCSYYIRDGWCGKYIRGFCLSYANNPIKTHL